MAPTGTSSISQACLASSQGRLHEGMVLRFYDGRFWVRRV